ncbi:MAG: signal peptidase I [Armatimonadetes bacterium]|nr:MAG: signal peptidase I [Armatimonadota bacterium]
MVPLLPIAELPELFHSVARATPAQVVLFAAVCTTIRVLALWSPGGSQPATLSLPYWGIAVFLFALGGLAVWQAGTLPGIVLVGIGGLLLVRATKRLRIAWRHLIQDVAEGLTYTAIFIFLLLRPYVIQTFEIPSPSMEPTLRRGDYLFVDKASYRWRDPRRGEVAVFRPPIEAQTVSGGPDELYVKRVIGVPGDVIEVIGGVLYRNDIPLDEPYVAERNFGEFKLVRYNGELVPIVRTELGQFPGGSLYLERIPPKDLFRVWDLPAEPIPQGMYFVLGDNRNNSVDSRYWGLVRRKDMVGRAWLRFFPLNRAGWVK